jgi:hypothetical protein
MAPPLDNPTAPGDAGSVDAFAAAPVAASAFVVRCPRCEGADLEPCDAQLAGSDESIQATHACRACGTRFRVVPPEREAWP